MSDKVAVSEEHRAEARVILKPMFKGGFYSGHDVEHIAIALAQREAAAYAAGYKRALLLCAEMCAKDRPLSAVAGRLADDMRELAAKPPGSK